MACLYKVCEIEGKNLGCIAVENIKKGTLILEEKPQCFDGLDPDPDPLQLFTLKDFQNMLKSFNEMNESEQEDYFKLYNNFEQKHWLSSVNLNINDRTKEKLENMIGIYVTNAHQKGVGIQASRFNHSCTPNAEVIWNDEKNIREIRTVTKIKIGDEISVTYLRANMLMKNLQDRQNFLQYQWGFKCTCDLCLQEELKCDNDIYEKYEQLFKQVKNLENSNDRLMNFTEEINCYKEMYKLAKEKRVSRFLIVTEILERGFRAAVQGYVNSFPNSNEMEKFGKEISSFSNVGEEISKIVFGDTHYGKLWKERKYDFENWLRKYMEKTIFEK